MTRIDVLNLKRLAGAFVAGLLLACSNNPSDSNPTGPSFANNPCLADATVTLGSAEARRVDCTNGGTTVTLAGNGASYLVVAQFATDQGVNQLIRYTLATGSVAAATASAHRASGQLDPWAGAMDGRGAPRIRPGRGQREFEARLLAQGRKRAEAGVFRATATGALSRQSTRSLAVASDVPPVGSVRSFHVLSSFSSTASTFETVGAKLVHVGNSVLFYVDTLSLGTGFTDAQLEHFGEYFDKVLAPLDTAAFGSPSDVDQNGHVIMLMSPTVNKDSPASSCATQGFVAGFFTTEDFVGPSDPNSNQGEVFYSIAPDPGGKVSCAHSVEDVAFNVPATFLHELQHLIYFSQHVILGSGQPGASWLDEGLSIVAEELGSLYYEEQCPATACRTTPGQLFPDSAQSFIQGFFWDSYQYALLPDTASITLHDDSEFGSSWRGGAWLLVRWLGDQFGAGTYRRLERGPSGGAADIESATGRPFPQLFADFGLALYTDSLPGLPRTTAPGIDRFTSRNVHQLWARLYATAGPSADVPTATPVVLSSITADTSVAVMEPGTMSFFRLDTPGNAQNVTIRFAKPGGAAFPASLGAQLAVFRLPTGQ